MLSSRPDKPAPTETSAAPASDEKTQAVTPLYVSIQSRVVFDEKDLLGRGAFAEVYKATYLGATIAVKRFIINVDNESKQQVLFREEIDKLRMIQDYRQTHPGTLSCALTYHGYNDQDHAIYFEYVAGQTISDMIRAAYVNEYEDVDSDFDSDFSSDDEPGVVSTYIMSPLICADLLTKIVTAGHELAEAKLLHNDYNTKNIMLTHDGKVKIIDWAFAEFLADGNLTFTLKSRRGTPRFSAYETVKDKIVSLATDTFCMGGIIYSLTYGRVPFATFPKKQDVLKQLLEEKHADIPRGKPQFEAIIRECWQVTPDCRPTMAELVIKFSALRRSPAQTWTYTKEISSDVSHPAPDKRI